MANIAGTYGNDRLGGTAYADEIVDLLGGNDVMFGGAGDDLLHVDRYHGQSGNFVRLFGEAGADELFAAGPANSDLRVRLSGGDGDDELDALSTAYARMDGGDGDDNIEAFRVAFARYDSGAGRDLLSVHTVDRAVIAAGDDGDYLFISNALGRTVVNMGSGDDFVWLAPGAGDDRVTVALGAGRDTVFLTPDPDTNAAYPAKLVITDFEPGFARDRLDPTAFLRAAGVDTVDPFASGHLDVVQRGDSAVLRFDRDAAGTAHGWETLVRFRETDAAMLVPYNLGASPSGSSVVDLSSLTL